MSFLFLFVKYHSQASFYWKKIEALCVAQYRISLKASNQRKKEIQKRNISPEIEIFSGMHACDCSFFLGVAITQDYTEEFRDITKGSKSKEALPAGSITLINQRPVGEDVHVKFCYVLHLSICLFFVHMLLNERRFTQIHIRIRTQKKENELFLLIKNHEIVS